MARVLVIDDDEALRATIREALEKAGHDVFTAPNGRGVTDLVTRARVEIVITDLFMPDTEGLETILALQDAAPGVAIIAMSGGGFAGTLDYLSEALELGATRAIAKPFRLPALLALIDDLSPRRRSA